MSVILLNVILMNVILLNVILINVILMNVVAPGRQTHLQPTFFELAPGTVSHFVFYTSLILLSRNETSQDYSFITGNLRRSAEYQSAPTSICGCMLSFPCLAQLSSSPSSSFWCQFYKTFFFVTGLEAK